MRTFISKSTGRAFQMIPKTIGPRMNPGKLALAPKFKRTKKSKKA